MPYLASASHVPSVGVSRSSVGAAIVLPSRKPPVTNGSEGSKAPVHQTSAPDDAVV